MALKLNIIIGSTRPGRIGPSVARWTEERARSHAKFDVELVDVASFELPVFDEPKHPSMQDYRHDHTKAWAASVAGADAFVFVTPEYNYFAPPALVNAIDYLNKEWGYKPAGIVSYGGLSGGLRAAQSLKALLTTVRMMPLPEGVAVPYVGKSVEEGVFKATDMMDEGATVMLDELHRWAEALKPMRG